MSPRLSRREFIAGASAIAAGAASARSVGGRSGSLLHVLNTGFPMCAVGNMDKWTNPYVTDGLIAMWDGEWNAGGGEHDANATTWKDLVGVADMRCSGSATFNPASVGIGNYFYTDAASSVVSAFNAHRVTLEIAYGDISQKWNNTGPFGIGEDSGVFKIQQNRLSNTGCNCLFCGDNWALSGVLGPQESPSMYVAFACDGTSRSAFVRGATVFTLTRTAQYTAVIPDGSRVYIGWSADNTYTGYDIHAVRIYNRALTASEVAANYAVDKARFGIQ